MSSLSIESNELHKQWNPIKKSAMKCKIQVIGTGSMIYYVLLKEKGNVRWINLLSLSAITMRRLCRMDATNRKIEHIPNITVIGNASTFKENEKQSVIDEGEKERRYNMCRQMHSFPTTQWLHNRKPEGLKPSPRSWNIERYNEIIHTLYSTTHTKILRGMRKKFIMVLLASSGMYWDLIFIMDGQKIPTQASKTQNPINWMQPEKEMLPPFTWDGATKNCSKSRKKER